MKAHVTAIIKATPLSCMLYNNPIAYKTDFLPEQIAELAAEHPNLKAVKESSADVRRVTAIHAVLGQRLQILVGVDDAIVEGVAAGAVGWIAGLVNAFPANRWPSSMPPMAGSTTKGFSSIPGSCRCCEWTWFRSLSQMIKLRKPRLAWATRGYGRQGWNWRGRNCGRCKIPFNRPLLPCLA